MYYQLAQQAVVTSAAQQVSQAAALTGANAVLVAMEAQSTGANVVQVIADVGNDQQNWLPAGTLTMDLATEIALYRTAAFTGLGAAYVRLRYNLSSGTGPVVLTGGLETKQL